MIYLYSSLSFHYIFKPEQLNFESLGKYLERLEFLKPKFVGLKLSEQQYTGTFTRKVRKSGQG